MKIAVDGYELGRGARGVGRVTQNLLLHLPGIMEGDTFVVLVKQDISPLELPSARVVVLPERGGFLRWQNGPLRRELRKEKPDLFIAANYILPLFFNGESLLIEHDISVVTHPEWYTRRYALPRRFLTARSLAKARRIIVPSEYIKTEILSRFAIDAARIHVCRWGIEEKFTRAAEEEVHAWRAKKGLTERVVVGFLGALNRRRHLPLLIRAVELLRRERPEAMLFIVGSDIGSFSRQELAQMFHPAWVRWERDLPEEELRLFYSSLDVFAFLSEYEGFGFPPLEALACGTPIVLLRRGALEEIFSDLAFMVEEPAAEEVAQALILSLTDTVSRRRKIELFADRRRDFSWANTAQKIARLLRNLESA